MCHDWPGNVRALENTLERASIMSADGIIDRDVIAMTGLEEELSLGTPTSTTPDLNLDGLDEREQVIAALEKAGWVQTKAARLLNLTPRQIAYRVKILNIKMKHI